MVKKPRKKRASRAEYLREYRKNMAAGVRKRARRLDRENQFKRRVAARAAMSEAAEKAFLAKRAAAAREAYARRKAARALQKGAMDGAMEGNLCVLFDGCRIADPPALGGGGGGDGSEEEDDIDDLSAEFAVAAIKASKEATKKKVVAGPYSFTARHLFIFVFVSCRVREANRPSFSLCA